MDVSVIIVNYKTAGLIGECLKSIVKFTEGIDYEVIIVDNNSECDFEDVIREKAGGKLPKDLKFLALPENIGFGRANNEGLKLAKGRNIFFLNPDTLLLNNALKILSDFLDSHPEAGACGGNLFDENLLPNLSFKRFLPGVFWELDELLNTIPQKIRFKKDKYFNHSGKPFKVGFVSGADFMVKRDVLDKTGAFREEYFMYFEETDLCFRIRSQGYRIFSVPDARIIHLEGKSFSPTEEVQSERKTELMEKSRKIYYSLNHQGIEGKLSNILYSLFLNSRILLMPKGRKKDYYKLRKKYFLSH